MIMHVQSEKSVILSDMLQKHQISVGVEIRFIITLLGVVWTVIVFSAIFIIHKLEIIRLRQKFLLDEWMRIGASSMLQFELDLLKEVCGLIIIVE